MQLGFDPNHKIVIDEKFDSATKAAVTAWEDSLGLTGDGKITKGEVGVHPWSSAGRHRLGDGRRLGQRRVGRWSSAGRPSASISIAGLLGRRSIDRLAAGRQGHDWHCLSTGATASRSWRSRATPRRPRCCRGRLSDGVTDGADVKLFEQALSAMGFTADANDDRRRPLRLGDGDRGRGVAGASLGVTADPASIVMPAGSFAVVPAGLSIGTALGSPTGRCWTGDARGACR